MIDCLVYHAEVLPLDDVSYRTIIRRELLDTSTTNHVYPSWGVLLSCSSSCWSKLCWARFVERPVSEHGEQHVSSSTGEGDDGLVVAFAFGAFLVVVGPRGGVAFNRSKSRQKQDTFEDFVAASGGCFAADRGPRLAGHGCDASI